MNEPMFAAVKDAIADGAPVVIVRGFRPVGLCSTTGSRAAETRWLTQVRRRR